MTAEQFWSLFRTILQMLGAALVTRGHLDEGSLQVLLGAIMAIVTTVYSLYIRRRAGLVATAAALPEVTRIVTTPDIAAKVDDPAVTTR